MARYIQILEEVFTSHNIKYYLIRLQMLEDCSFTKQG